MNFDILLPKSPRLFYLNFLSIVCHFKHVKGVRNAELVTPPPSEPASVGCNAHVASNLCRGCILRNCCDVLYFESNVNVISRKQFHSRMH
jgi:hypothetical protein